MDSLHLELVSRREPLRSAHLIESLFEKFDEIAPFIGEPALQRNMQDRTGNPRVQAAAGALWRSFQAQRPLAKELEPALREIFDLFVATFRADAGSIALLPELIAQTFARLDFQAQEDQKEVDKIREATAWCSASLLQAATESRPESTCA